MLDDLLAEAESLDALREALKVALHDDPVAFWKGIIAPLLPKETRLDVDLPPLGLVRVTLPHNGRDALDPHTVVIEEESEETSRGNGGNHP